MTSAEREPGAPQLLKHVLVLVLSLSAALLATLLLSFVWEMSIDGKDYRRLYPSPLVEIMLVGAGVVGCALLLNEIFRVVRVPLLAYPVTAALYFGALISMTYLFTYDFAISRSHPLEPKNSEQGGADQPTAAVDLKSE